jgi:hypothetical protein
MPRQPEAESCRVFERLRERGWAHGRGRRTRHELGTRLPGRLAPQARRQHTVAHRPRELTAGHMQGQFCVSHPPRRCAPRPLRCGGACRAPRSSRRRPRESSDAGLPRKASRWPGGGQILPVELRLGSELGEAFSKGILGGSTPAVRNYWNSEVSRDVGCLRGGFVRRGRDSLRFGSTGWNRTWVPRKNTSRRSRFSPFVNTSSCTSRSASSSS